MCLHALLAQLVEHLHGKEGVAGSSPSEGLICRGFSCESTLGAPTGFSVPRIARASAREVLEKHQMRALAFSGDAALVLVSQ